MDERLLGTWKIHKEENVDALLAASKISFFLRKMAQKISYTLEFINEGDSSKILMVNRFKKTKTEFKMGEEFDEEDFSGKLYKSKFSVEDGMLLVGIRNPVEEGDPVFYNKFYIKDDGELVFVSTITNLEPNIVATRTFKKV